MVTNPESEGMEFEPELVNLSQAREWPKQAQVIEYSNSQWKDYIWQ